MNWYTVEACQQRANKHRRTICAWIPKPVPIGAPRDADGVLMWIIDTSGKVRDFVNPDGDGTVPWETKYSYKRVFRPEVKNA